MCCSGGCSCAAVPALIGGSARRLQTSCPLSFRDCCACALIPLQWFDDADDAVLGPCLAALDVLVELGATVKRITLPELELLRVAASLVLITELHQAHRTVYDDPGQRSLVRPRPAGWGWLAPAAGQYRALDD